MAYKKISNIEIENAHLFFKNFAGKETKFNRAGNRNFCVTIEPELVNALIDDGWNVKTLTPKDPDDEPRYYIQVTVHYGQVSPSVYLIVNNGQNKVELDEESIDSLDYAEIKSVDLVIRPYNWEVNGKTGVKAYLKTMYVVIEEDRFATKYRDIHPDEPEIDPNDLPF